MDLFLSITYLIVFLSGFLLFFKLIKDSNFPKIFKNGKTNSIIVASILISLILGYLLASMVVKFLEVILIIVR